MEMVQSCKEHPLPRREVPPDQALPSHWQQQCLTLGELCLLTNVPFRPWGRGQDKNSWARKHFIEKHKLQTSLKQAHKFPLNCHGD